MSKFQEKYNFANREKYWQEYWQQHGVYNWDQEALRGDSYVIDTPPPTVSGLLHIGHVYSYTHTDVIARYQRMKGMNVFYPMGFDDNGLPTERLVEKKKDIRAVSMERQKFVEICKEVVQEEEKKFYELFNSIALSVDWSLQYCTISPLCTKISQLSFLDLVSKEQVYRNSQPILWDPVDQTALSQADIEDHEKTTFMNDIIFTTENGQNITIATTRPELLPACVAVLFHPDDTRYQHLQGQSAITPLFKVKVPLIADDMVDPEKGTGLVMCCTFGDQTDVLWWRRYNLPIKTIISKRGTIENIAFDESCIDPKAASDYMAQIEGLKVTQARQKMIELLQEAGLLLAQHERTQVVKCAERSGAPLEILTTPQWFIKAIEHKDALIKKANELNWHPKTMKIKLESWINAVSLDWCISRQRFFGVPFPVWYSKRPGEEGKIIFADIDQLPVDPLRDLPKGYSRDEVEADMDVMDTWSTSSVSPQLNSHGISGEHMVDAKRHAKLFPADLRPQAHEILRSWAYYTMLKSHLHADCLPWKNIMISGWCLAEDRSKMSKSKGNIIDPQKLLTQFGSDVVRYWASSAKLGADTAYSEDVMNNGKRLVNKLWNAGKFVSQHFDKIPNKLKNLSYQGLQEVLCYDMDHYFLARLVKLVSSAKQALEAYEYADALMLCERFFWDFFCDNYLEISKTRAYDEDGINPEGSLSAKCSLYYGFKIILQLFAPFVPHITEEIYQIIYTDEGSIHRRGNWPVLDEGLEFANAENMKQAQQVLAIVNTVRKAKASNNLSVKAPVQKLELENIRLSESLLADLSDVISASEIITVDVLSEIDESLLQDSQVRIALWL
jgi:valyl-tRNA synthetase